MDVEVDDLGRGRVVRVLGEHRLDGRKDGTRHLGDDAGIAERLEVHAHVILDLNELPHTDAGVHRLERHGRDAATLDDLDRVAIDGQEAHRERGDVNEAGDAPGAVAENLPVGVARDFEVLAGAPSEVDEGVVEAGELEEVVQPRPLDARELKELRLARRDLFGRRLQRHVAGELAAVVVGETLARDAIGDAGIGVVGLLVDGGLEPVAERVNVRGVGVDVRSQRIRMLEEHTKRGWIVRRGDRACRREVRVLASRNARRVLHVEADNDRFEDRARTLGHLGDALADHGVGRSSAYAMRRPLGAKEIALTRKPRASSCACAARRRPSIVSALTLIGAPGRGGSPGAAPRRMTLTWTAASMCPSNGTKRFARGNGDTASRRWAGRDGGRGLMPRRRHYGPRAATAGPFALAESIAVAGSGALVVEAVPARW